MVERSTYSIELNTSMYAFLEQMAREHDLPDASKAVRCLVNYAREDAERRQTIFSEIRCMDC